MKNYIGSNYNVKSASELRDTLGHDGDVAYVIKESDNKVKSVSAVYTKTAGKWVPVSIKGSSDSGSSTESTLFNGTNVRLNSDNLNKISGDLVDFSFVDFMNALSYKESTLSLSSNLSTLNYEIGDKLPNGITLNISVGVGSAQIKQIKIFKNNISAGTITNKVTNGGNFTFADGSIITSNTVYRVVVTDNDNKTIEKSLSIQFYSPYYYGVIDKAITDIVSDDLTILKKDITKKENKTYSFTANNGYCVIAYPKSYGQLKSILDSNNFENIYSMSQKEITINSITYYVYETTSKVTCNNFKYKFVY